MLHADPPKPPTGFCQKCVDLCDLDLAEPLWAIAMPKEPEKLGGFRRMSLYRCRDQPTNALKVVSIGYD